MSTPAYNAALKAFAIGKALQPGLDFFHDMKKVWGLTLKRYDMMVVMKEAPVVTVYVQRN